MIITGLNPQRLTSLRNAVLKDLIISGEIGFDDLGRPTHYGAGNSDVIDGDPLLTNQYLDSLLKEASEEFGNQSNLQAIDLEYRRVAEEFREKTVEEAYADSNLSALYQGYALERFAEKDPLAVVSKGIEDTELFEEKSRVRGFRDGFRKFYQEWTDTLSNQGIPLAILGATALTVYLKYQQEQYAAEQGRSSGVGSSSDRDALALFSPYANVSALAAPVMGVVNRFFGSAIPNTNTVPAQVDHFASQAMEASPLHASLERFYKAFPVNEVLNAINQSGAANQFQVFQDTFQPTEQQQAQLVDLCQRVASVDNSSLTPQAADALNRYIEGECKAIVGESQFERMKAMVSTGAKTIAGTLVGNALFGPVGGAVFGGATMASAAQTPQPSTPAPTSAQYRPFITTSNYTIPSVGPGGVANSASFQASVICPPNRSSHRLDLGEVYYSATATQPRVVVLNGGRYTEVVSPDTTHTPDVLILQNGAQILGLTTLPNYKPVQVMVGDNSEFFGNLGPNTNVVFYNTSRTDVRSNNGNLEVLGRPTDYRKNNVTIWRGLSAESSGILANNTAIVGPRGTGARIYPGYTDDGLFTDQLNVTSNRSNFERSVYLRNGDPSCDVRDGEKSSVNNTALLIGFAVAAAVAAGLAVGCCCYWNNRDARRHATPEDGAPPQNQANNVAGRNRRDAYRTTL